MDAQTVVKLIFQIRHLFIYIRDICSEIIIIELNYDESEKLSGREDEIRRKHSRRSRGQYAGNKKMEKNKTIRVHFEGLILNFIKCFVPMSKELCRLEVRGVISYLAFCKYWTVVGR